MTARIDDALLSDLNDMGAEELCPKASMMTKELVDLWHSMGFRVRAWGVSDRSLMERAYRSGADGMTVNFPDVLAEYHRKAISQ